MYQKARMFTGTITINETDDNLMESALGIEDMGAHVGAMSKLLDDKFQEDSEGEKTSIIDAVISLLEEGKLTMNDIFLMAVVEYRRLADMAKMKRTMGMPSVEDLKRRLGLGAN